MTAGNKSVFAGYFKLDEHQTMPDCPTDCFVNCNLLSILYRQIHLHQIPPSTFNACNGSYCGQPLSAIIPSTCQPLFPLQEKGRPFG